VGTWSLFLVYCKIKFSFDPSKAEVGNLLVSCLYQEISTFGQIEYIDQIYGLLLGKWGKFSTAISSTFSRERSLNNR
jgi:hypothetical protein